MSFRVWFKQWIRAFCKLVSFNYKKPKSEAQRRRERERRLKAKHSSSNLYRTKKKYQKRRRSMDVQNEKLWNAMFGFIGASLGILLLPFGLFDWGRKSAKARKGSRAAAKASRTKKASTRTTKKKAATAQASRASAVHTSNQVKENSRSAPSPSSGHTEYKADDTGSEAPPVVEADESISKSTPKNKKDRYIRKRMIIAGAYYCDNAVLDTLEVGSYVDLEAEPDNPYDKDAVKLLFNGQKIGYVAQKDHSVFVTCLRLKRNIYGVITAIFEEDGHTKYEFETWFESADPHNKV